MIKASMGILKIDFNPIETAEQSGFELLDFKAEDALQLKDLLFHHKDPCDRMLIAQNLANNCLIITDDERFNKYECKLI